VQVRVADLTSISSTLHSHKTSGHRARHVYAAAARSQKPDTPLQKRSNVHLAVCNFKLQVSKHLTVFVGQVLAHIRPWPAGGVIKP
jgi:hypothetical protein